MTFPAGPFYHGSYRDYPMGFRFTGGGQAYHEEWIFLPCYEALHLHRPAEKIAHQDAVFMCEKPEHIEPCGGATERLILIRPSGEIQRHDNRWGQHIADMIDEGREIDHPEVAQACLSYWQGEPCGEGEPLWEYLAREARVIACCDFCDPDPITLLASFDTQAQDNDPTI